LSNKYIGPESCYARNEGVWVPRIGRTGVTDKTFWGVIALILRDLRRGWTYGDSCERIPMDFGRAYGRALYAGALAHTYIDKALARELMRRGIQAVKAGRLPPDAEVYLTGPNADRVARELVELGVASPGQVRVLSLLEAYAVSPP